MMIYILMYDTLWCILVVTYTNVTKTSHSHSIQREFPALWLHIYGTAPVQFIVNECCLLINWCYVTAALP